MKHKQPKRSSRLQNLYSKFKRWCIRHSVPTVLVPIVIVALVGVVLLFVGGALLDWNLFSVLSSPTAVLIFAIAIAICAVAASFLFNKRR